MGRALGPTNGAMWQRRAAWSRCSGPDTDRTRQMVRRFRPGLELPVGETTRSASQSLDEGDPLVLWMFPCAFRKRVKPT